MSAKGSDASRASRLVTAQANVALEAELRRRSLKESDLEKHRRSVRRYEQIDSKKRHRRILGRWSDGRAWIDILLALLLIFLISTAYRQLPSQYHFNPDWEEAAVNVMWLSVFIAVCGFHWRTITFWVSLVVSSCVHLVVVHACFHRNTVMCIPAVCDDVVDCFRRCGDSPGCLDAHSTLLNSSK